MGSRGTPDPLEFILNPAPRGILLKPEVNHVTPLYKTFQWHLTSLETNPKFSAWPPWPCVLRPVLPLPSHLLPRSCLHTPPSLLARHLCLAAPQVHPRPLLRVFAFTVPSAWYAFPRQLMVHSTTLMRSQLRRHLIREVFSVH